VQFSDLHLGCHYSLNQLLRAVHRINSEQPDIVFFTGDLINDQQKYIEGFYSVKQKDGGAMMLYVNRRLGTTRARVRCFAKLEITVFTLQHG
jgi:predicted MPP superfamily phosphohydrolase